MAVFRVEKTKDYTVMSNYHLHNAMEDYTVNEALARWRKLF